MDFTPLLTPHPLYATLGPDEASRANLNPRKAPLFSENDLAELLKPLSIR